MDLTRLLARHAIQTASDTLAGFWTGLLNVKLGYASGKLPICPTTARSSRCSPLPTPPSTGVRGADPLRLAAGADHRRRACPDRGGTDLPVQGLSGAVLCGGNVGLRRSCGGFNLHWASAAALPPGGTPQSTFAAENGNKKGTRESPRAFPRPFYSLNQAALFSPLESSFARSSAGRSARYSTTAQTVEATLFTKVTPPAILVSACATVYSCPKMYTLRK